MSDYGYTFYFQDGENLLTFPITPGKLSIKLGSNNKVVTLIDEGEINILKSPSLAEIEFEARFPMRNYPYSRTPKDITAYYEMFKDLKVNKKSFRFIVARTTPKGSRTWDTDLLVALEDFTIKEDADEGDDVLITFKLKQYKYYGIKILHTESANPPTTSTSDEERGTDNKASTTSSYTVKPGDCLWAIAKALYGDGSKWTAIWEANKELLDKVAQQHGKASSSSGHWIYPGTELVIPSLDEAKNIVQSVGDDTGTTASTTTKGYMVSILNKLTGGDVLFTLTYVRNGQKRVNASRDSINQMVDAGTRITLDIKYNNDSYPTANHFYVTCGQQGGNYSAIKGLGQYNTTRTVNSHLNFVVQHPAQAL